MTDAPWDDPSEDDPPRPESDGAEDAREAANTAALADPPARHEPGEDEQGEYACPECGKRFRRPMHRGLHRKREHGIIGSAPKDKTPKHRAGSKRSRGASNTADAAPPPAGSEGRRKRVIKETLIEVADLIDGALGRSGPQPDNLTDIVRRDADKQAASIAAAANRLEPLGALIDALFGLGGPLSFVLAFGPTLRKLRSLRSARAREQEEQQWQALQDVPAEYQSPVEWPPAP